MIELKVGTYPLESPVISDGMVMNYLKVFEVQVSPTNIDLAYCLVPSEDTVGVRVENPPISTINAINMVDWEEMVVRRAAEFNEDSQLANW